MVSDSTSAGERQREGDDDEMGDVGQDMAADDVRSETPSARAAATKSASRSFKRFAARDAAEVHPAGHAERDAHLQRCRCPAP